MQYPHHVLYGKFGDPYVLAWGGNGAWWVHTNALYYLDHAYDLDHAYIRPTVEATYEVGPEFLLYMLAIGVYHEPS